MSKAQEKAVAFVVGVLLLLIVISAALWGPYKDSSMGPLVLRTVLALAAAGFAGFLVGKISVNVSPGVRASGALGVFALVFLVNPPDPTSKAPSVLPPYQGYLGELHDQIQRTTSDKEFVLALSSEYKPQLRQFWIYPAIAASDHAELLRKVCRAYAECLKCEPAADQITNRVDISWRSAPAPLSSERGQTPQYTCNATIATSAPSAQKPVDPQKPVLGKPIYEVAETDPVRRAAPTVGKLLLASGETFTAFMISRNHALTKAYAVTNQHNMRLQLGYHAATERPIEYPVAGIAEIDQPLDYAILEIAGNPGDNFGFLTLGQTPLSEGAGISVIHHSGGSPLTLSTGKITAVAGAKLFYTAETTRGSGGSPILNANGQVVGLHIGSEQREGGIRKEGVAISAIMAKSALLKPSTAPPS